MLELYVELFRVAVGEQISEELFDRMASRDIEVLADSEVLRRLETWDDA